MLTNFMIKKKNAYKVQPKVSFLRVYAAEKERQANYI